MSSIGRTWLVLALLLLLVGACATSKIASPEPAPTPSATPTPPPPSPTPTPTDAERLGLAQDISEGVALYHSLNTPPNQIAWVKETYGRTQRLLLDLLGLSLSRATVYLLDPEVYGDLQVENQFEGIQGFTRDGVAYINQAPVVAWDVSVPAEEQQAWQEQHLQEITQAITAHELTHVALHGRLLPRWLEEGLAQEVEARLAPPESATRQQLQRRYRARAALADGLFPTSARLAAPDWGAVARGEQDLWLLYDTSALLIQALVSQQGDASLRLLVEQPGALDSLELLLEDTLVPWLRTPLPQERAALVLCGVNRFLALKGEAVDEWDRLLDSPTPDYLAFRQRLETAMALLEALPADSLVEEVRSDHLDSIVLWAEAAEHYSYGDFFGGNRLLAASTSLSTTASEVLQRTWEEHVVVPCPVVEAQLGGEQGPGQPTSASNPGGAEREAVN